MVFAEARGRCGFARTYHRWRVGTDLTLAGPFPDAAKVIALGMKLFACWTVVSAQG
jgi:hypothetical protein